MASPGSRHRARAALAAAAAGVCGLHHSRGGLAFQDWRLLGGCWSAPADAGASRAPTPSRARALIGARPLLPQSRQPQVPRRAAGGAAALLDARRLLWLRRSVLGLGVSGQLLYVLVFVLSQLTPVVPVTPFMVAAAYIWGEPWSYVLVSLGVVGSAVCGFALSRFALRPQVCRMFAGRPEVERICAAVGRQGFRIALLCRLSLVLPTAPMTFALGALTDISFVDFIGATLFGSLPEAWATVYLASSVEGTLQHGSLPWYVYAGAVVAIITLISTVARIAKRALDKSVDA